MITFGPCQTPTLGFCVERHREIEAFRPTTFYRVEVRIDYPGQEGLALYWEKEQTLSREEAIGVKDAVSSIGALRGISI